MAHHETSSKGLGKSFFLILIGFFLIGFLTHRATRYFSAHNQNYDQTRAEERAKKLAELTEKEKAILTTYGVVDAAKGIYRIPLNRAIELELAALRQKTVKPVAVIPLPEVKK
jgi:hypothetical protein